MDVSKRAKVLIQAMPYIKKYSGETIVVKYGGNAMINEELKAAVMSDLVLMLCLFTAADQKSMQCSKPLARKANLSTV